MILDSGSNKAFGEMLLTERADRNHRQRADLREREIEGKGERQIGREEIGEGEIERERERGGRERERER